MAGGEEEHFANFLLLFPAFLLLAFPAYEYFNEKDSEKQKKDVFLPNSKQGACALCPTPGFDGPVKYFFLL